MDRFKRPCEVFTTDEDWQECWMESEEDEVYRIAEKIGGEVVLCYYFERMIEYPSSTDGEFEGFLIRKDGKIYGVDEIDDIC